MSALTKIGVVLLVIASLMLSAGVVVFVNRAPSYQQALDSIKVDLDKERLKTIDALADAYRARIDKDSIAADNRNAILKLEADIVAKNREIAKLTDEKVAETKEKDKANALVKVTADSVDGLQKQIDAHVAHIKELRVIRDGLVNERFNISAENAELRAQVEILKRAVRVNEDRAGNMRAELNDLKTRLGSTPNVKPEMVMTDKTAGAGYLEGVVNSVFDTGGKRWASISIGAKENVQKSMKFSVHNDKDFLGYLIIQVTEPNEAAGVLEGPGVSKVKQGDQVKTQLQ